MKAAIFTFFTAASIASAQFVGVPACAQECLTSAISSAGCPITDVGCQCASTAAIQNFGAGCILGACTASGEIGSAISGGAALCVNYFATVSASATDSVSSPSSAEATTTLRSTSTATSTVTVATTDISSPVSSPSVTSAASTRSSVGTTSSRVSTSAGSASTTASQVPPNAGERVGVAGYLGGVLGLGAAMLAL